MPTSLHVTPGEDYAASARNCWNCFVAGVARSVTTVSGRPIVLVTLRCPSCGHEWNVERESQTSINQTLDPLEFC